MEANPDRGTEPLLSVVARQVPQLLDLDLVGLQKEAVRGFLRLTCSYLSLIDVCEAWISILCCNAGRSGKDVLEPVALEWNEGSKLLFLQLCIC